MTRLHRPRVALAGSLCLLAAARAPESGTQDPHRSFRTMRVVSPSGQHYAVLRARNGSWPGPFEFVRRRDGAAPIEPTGQDLRVRRNRFAGRDPEDQLLAEGTLTQLPMDAAVVDEPPGLLMFDQYARAGHGRTLWFRDAQGQLVWSKDLHDLFGGIPTGTMHSFSSRYWNAKWQVDHRAGLVWVLTTGGEFRAVALRDGTVSEPTAQQVSRWLGDERVLDAVLASDRDPAGFVTAASRIASDPRQSLGIRLRAAVLARRGGDPTDHERWFRQTVAHGTTLLKRRAETAPRETRIESMSRLHDEKEAIVFAALHLDEVTNSETIDVVSSVLLAIDDVLDRDDSFLSGLGFGTWRPQFVEAFRRAGESGSRELQRLLASPNTPARTLIDGTLIHWDLGHRSSPPRFLALIESADESDASLAVHALIRHDPPDLADQMLAIAGRGTAATTPVAGFFLDHPDPDAVPHLQRMLGPDLDDGTRWTIQNAVEACRQGR